MNVGVGFRPALTSDITQTKEKPEMIYKVTSPLDHDNRRYEIGETVELTSEQAAILVKVKTVDPVPVPDVDPVEIKKAKGKK